MLKKTIATVSMVAMLFSAAVAGANPTPSQRKDMVLVPSTLQQYLRFSPAQQARMKKIIHQLNGLLRLEKQKVRGMDEELAQLKREGKVTRAAQNALRQQMTYTYQRINGALDEARVELITVMNQHQRQQLVKVCADQPEIYPGMTGYCKISALPAAKDDGHDAQAEAERQAQRQAEADRQAQRQAEAERQAQQRAEAQRRAQREAERANNPPVNDPRPEGERNPEQLEAERRAAEQAERRAAMEAARAAHKRLPLRFKIVARLPW